MKLKSKLYDVAGKRSAAVLTATKCMSILKYNLLNLSEYETEMSFQNWC